MKWSASLLAVPLLYLLNVPWVARLNSKVFGDAFSDKISSYYSPWKWLARPETMKPLLWDYALWCDGRAGEPDPPSIFSNMIMHPEEEP